MRGIVRALAAFMLFVLAPGVVYAQATLAESPGILPARFCRASLSKRQVRF